eukprot:1430504-Lingulodinium_polyedra.AAC.1
MERASAQFVSRRGSKTSLQPQHGATSVKCWAATRSNRRFAARPAHKPHARALDARTDFRSA